MPHNIHDVEQWRCCYAVWNSHRAGCHGLNCFRNRIRLNRRRRHWRHRRFFCHTDQLFLQLLCTQFSQHLLFERNLCQLLLRRLLRQQLALLLLTHGLWILIYKLLMSLKSQTTIEWHFNFCLLQSRQLHFRACTRHSQSSSLLVSYLSIGSKSTTFLCLVLFALG